ncbi:hypothetical protein SAMN06269173_101170 [Hymenobacter mucosus]|uniref:Uncharacterized protein n=1 Tax=Hymenobacter mucosus TaxID=1411120 RepID=A0A238V5S1_9BACT|nr:hypothetical protein SAMN06269173_101170 [Hymenobacter mucosus]
MKRYTIIVECTTTGYSAYAADHNVSTTDTTLAEIKSNAIEAFNLYFVSCPKRRF